MYKTAANLFNVLLLEAIDISNNPTFKTYSKMTTNHAEKMIIGSMVPNKLIRNENHMMVRLGDQLSHITLNKPHYVHGIGYWHPLTNEFEDEPPMATIRITLPFSSKWIFGKLKCRDIRRIEDSALLYRLIRKMTKNNE